jgi:hypothetical protein
MTLAWAYDTGLFSRGDLIMLCGTGAGPRPTSRRDRGPHTRHGILYFDSRRLRTLIVSVTSPLKRPYQRRQADGHDADEQIERYTHPKVV